MKVVLIASIVVKVTMTLPPVDSSAYHSHPSPVKMQDMLLKEEGKKEELRLMQLAQEGMLGVHKEDEGVGVWVGRVVAENRVEESCVA